MDEITKVFSEYQYEDNAEGYIMISEPTSKVSLIGMIDLVIDCIKEMGIKGSIQFFKDMKSSGESLENK